MNYLISGTRGEGKSTLSLWLAQKFASTVIIIDPRGTFDGTGITVYNLDELWDELRTKKYMETDPPSPIIFRPDGKFELTPIMSMLFPAYFAGFKGKIAIIVDEARQFQSPHWIDDALDRVVRQAPIERVLVIQNTHQLQDWNPATKSVMDDIFIFRQIGKQAIKSTAEQTNDEVAELARNLPEHHLIHYWFNRRSAAQLESEDKKRGELNLTTNYSVWDDPDRWYVPLPNVNGEPSNSQALHDVYEGENRLERETENE